MGWRRKLGIVIVILGISFGLWVLITQVFFCMDMWHNDYKAQSFETFSDYLFSVSKGAVFISAASVLLSTSVGILLFHCKKGT